MFIDPEELQEQEMRRQRLVEEAVSKADAVILEHGVSEDDMFELTYLVGMKLLEKISFQMNLRRQRKQIEESFNATLQPKLRSDKSNKESKR